MATIGPPVKRRTGSADADAVVDRRRTTMRAQIEKAASLLFFEHGFEATSIRMIVVACGVTPAAFYNHFPTKEELLYGIVADGHEKVGQAMKAALAGSDNPIEQLRAIVGAYVRFHTERRIEALVANSEYSALPEPRLSEIRRTRVALRGMFEAVIRRGLEEGAFDLPSVEMGLEVRSAAVAIGDMCLRVAEWYRPDGQLDGAIVERVYATYALRLVGADRSARHRR